MSFIASFYDPKNPSKSLTAAYVLALSIIALLTVCGHFTTYHIMKKQAESTDFTYHLSRIRGLVQRIPYHMENFANHLNEIDQEVLKQSVIELKTSHHFITSRIKADSTISPSLNNIYFHSNFRIEDNSKYYFDIIKKCIDQDIYTGEPSKVCFIAVELLGKGVVTSIVSGLDVALEGYRLETLNKIRLYHMIQIVATFIILGVLLLEAYFIFRPLIRKNAYYLRMLTRQAMEDPLTKLMNRRAFSKSLNAHIKGRAREGRNVSVAIMDLDKFKNVNDTYGHDVGDAVLVHFSKVLRKCLRTNDLIGRLGGEEFSVVLTHSEDEPPENSYNVLERLRDFVEKNPAPYKDKNGKLQHLHYSVSIGLVRISAEDQTVDALLGQADQLLYQAKEAGRNRVVYENFSAE